MKTILLKAMALASLLLLLPAVSEGKNDDTKYKYELESFNGDVAAKEGYCIVKVWNYGRKEDITRDNCMRNAIHGILFKGYMPTGSRMADQGKKPLVPEGYDAHKKYFDDFFKSGDYLQYVQLTNKGQMNSGDVIKIAKKEYKVGMVVLVNFNGLRDRLEKDKIVKSLDFLFK